MVFGDFGFNFDDMLRGYAGPKSSKKLKHKAYNPIMDGLDLTGVMAETKRPFAKKQKTFKQAPNLLFDGLDLSGTLNTKGVDFVGPYGNEMLGGDFFKYLNTKGNYGDIRGIGKESKKSRSRRTIRYSESQELYGIEGLENAVADSYDSLEKSGRKTRQYIAKKAKDSKYKTVRTLAMKPNIRGDLSSIKSRIKAFGTRQKIKKSLAPDFDTELSRDKSREIAETYGEVRTDPRYELPERKYDFDDESKRSGK